MRVTVRSRKARSCETTARPPAKPSTKRSRRSSPSKSRSFVGSSSRSRSKRESRIAARPARAASPPESVAVSWSSDDRQAELGADRPSPRLEVGAAEREKPLQRGGVGVRAPGGRVALHRLVRVRDARAAREVAQERLAGAAIVLLRQVADPERRRRPLDRALVRLLEPGREAEQRRLAGAVRADEAEPQPGRRASARRDRGRCGRRTSGRRRETRRATEPPGT